MKSLGEKDNDLRKTAKVLTALKMRKMDLYVPYPKVRDFHNLGVKYRERALFAGNQLGKTYGASMEMAYHLTGEYPDWWEGRRFVRPITACAANTNNETVRDNPQRLMLGKPNEWGTGAIPRSCIEKKPTMSRGFPDLVDTVLIKHKSGGVSSLQFKAYDQGRKAFQGYTWDAIWCDEEPPAEVYGEIIARITATGGMIFLTMTPLLGMSEVVSYFYPEPNSPGRSITMMTIEDAGHIDEDEREAIVSGYAEHERKARALGIPLLGSGLIFNIPHESFEVDPFDVPKHWPKIIGMDFGYGDHPTAAVKVAWDREADIYYVVSEYKDNDTNPAVHASALRHWGANDIPVAWPHDGARDWGNTGPLAGVYRREGIRMLREHATFPEGGFSTEAAIQSVLARLQTGRMKVFGTCRQIFDELATYHRKDGFIVKQRDDLISALFKAVMMMRYSRMEAKHAPAHGALVNSEFNPFEWSTH